jgi:hypothetical protein
MANELTHKDPGTTITQAEYISSDGTGHVFESQAQGDTLYASSTTVLSRLAKDANATRVLTNTGTNNNPAWAQVTLTTGVTGTLPVANGGTGASALTNLITLGTHTTGNYAATVANTTNGGTTIANSGSESAAITITINLNDLTAATVNVANDSIAIIDADASSGSRKESIADFVSAIAGANLTATSGVLAASGGGGVPNAFFFA